MLKLKNISKSYVTGDFKQQALNKIDLEFRKNEFVSILGPSGSGKTTLLNIIGGLDRYDHGDLIINGKSTKKFKDVDWDAYRNNCIGFIFQSYNLIGHISILENVEMGMTLGGVSSSVRKSKAYEALKKVGLADHVHKRPNQLSGGQMQRVAIARALVNDPDIILADEPTGALDSKTSVQIMELIKEIAKEKLVIMVTHNNTLANEYSNRIVELRDGAIINDSNPINKDDVADEHFKIKKTAMSFFTALHLSFNNIRTKKGRTLLTAFASSIGIIGIALILALSNGFNIQIEEFQNNTLSSMPIIISEQAMNLTEDEMMKLHNEDTSKINKYPSQKEIYAYKPITDKVLHKNKLTSDYVSYIEKLSADDVSGLSYIRITKINAVVKTKDDYKKVADTSNIISIPRSLDKNKPGVLEENYDLLVGKIPDNKNEAVLIVDSKNRVDIKLLENLGFDVKSEKFSFDEVLAKELRIVVNDDFYKNMGNFYTINNDLKKMYESKSSMSLKIVGIIRGKEGRELFTDGTGIGYTEELLNELVAINSESKIVKDQLKKDYSILTGQKFDETEDSTNTKENTLGYLGYDSVPVAIYVYPRDFASKDNVLSYLDAYNTNKAKEDQIVYTDMAAMISSLSGNIMNAITIVLIAFSAISLVVSSIMIGIITYISVLERTKEIGVLRALGARKKDITRVFNAETFIIGLASGLLGIFIAWLLVFPANMIIESMTELANVAKLNPVHALILITVSIILTIIGGFIPAKIASRKDPVIALRTE